MSSIIYNYTKEDLQALLDSSYSYSDILKKMDLNASSGNYKTLHKVINEYQLNTKILEENRKNNNYGHPYSSRPLSEYLKENCCYPTDRLKKRLFKEGIKEEKCEICGLISWLDKEISLQLHHKDGDNTNNSLENLQILCPNCHSQTNNYAGKNAKKKIKYKCKICGAAVSTKQTEYCKECKKNVLYEKFCNCGLYPSRDLLKELIYNKSFVDIGKQFNVTDNAIRRWCKKYNLPYRIRDINQYTPDEWIFV